METQSAVPAVRPADRTAAVSKALFAVTVWGASFIATKIALTEIAPVTVVWLRFAMGVAVMGAVVARRRQLAVPSPADLAYFTGLGFLGITFHQWLQSNGLVTAQAGTTAWIVASTPIFMALLGRLVLRERLGWLRTVGIAVAALGVLAVVSKGDFSSVVAGRFGTPGDFLILLSAPNWAVFSVLSRRGLRRHSSAGMMFWVMATGWLLTTVLFLLGPGAVDVARLSLRGWTAVAFLGVACSGLAYVFWYDALRELPASQVGAFLYLEPLVAVVFAAVLIGEPVLLATVAGGFAILLGVWLVSLRPVSRV
ncbi:MAG TPA: DMT family transporter [Thermoanaerobaculia bacterium]|jgi:drug/metabolite transporter (DMT)-like permease|nr:DMT family transporter [Thermoanaerobaculia bacterium]